MTRPRQEDLVRALLERHGRTFADELGIDVAKGTPSPLFRLLCAAVLMSARISSEIATEAARELARHGWGTAQRLAESSWDERVAALNAAGYARYQERTATMLGDLADHVLEHFRGDLRRLRDAAGRDPQEQRRLLREHKGLGDVGVDIFFREAQVAWPELRPFADARARDAAERLGLPKDAEALGDLAGRDLPRLVAALVRTDLAGDHAAVREAARAA